MNLFLFGLRKTETGAKTAPRVPKFGYFDGWVPKLSSRVTLATAWSVICSVEYFTVFLCSSHLSIIGDLGLGSCN